MPHQSCRTCRWLRVEPNAAGRRVVFPHRLYPCDFPLPRLPALPDSITGRAGWKRPSDDDKLWMGPDDGTNCPTYERAAKAA